MKIKSIYPIIVVENLEESVKFYTELMGFEKKHDIIRKDGRHVLVLACGDIEIELMEKFAGGPVSLPTGLAGLRMNVDDIKAAAKEFEEKGGTIVSAPIETANTINMIVKDKDGVSITLMQHIK